jgi:hypothetical protein
MSLGQTAWTRPTVFQVARRRRCLDRLGAKRVGRRAGQFSGTLIAPVLPDCGLPRVFELGEEFLWIREAREILLRIKLVVPRQLHEQWLVDHADWLR